jgi:hypothetical protein
MIIQPLFNADTNNFDIYIGQIMHADLYPSLHDVGAPNMNAGKSCSEHT